jgi:hypothetical protein
VRSVSERCWRLRLMRSSLELERAVLRAAAANSHLADLYLFSCLKTSQAMEISGRLRETTISLTPQAKAGLEALDQDFVEDVRAVFRVTSTAFQRSVVEALAPESPQQARARHAGAFLEGLCDVVTLGLSKRAREG